MIKHYDLFAGIGGFSYALDKIFYDQEIEHIFCEWEAFPTAVLKKHWPDGTFYQDIDKMVEELTGMSAIKYNTKHGLSTVEEIRQRSKPLSKRDVSARHRELLRNIETGDVEDTAQEGLRDEKKHTLWQGQSLSQRHESERQGAEHFREGNTERSVDTSNPLREVQGHRHVQGRSDKNTSASPRLQQTARGDVAMSKVSPRVAQELQSKNLNYERTITDTKCEGRAWEPRQTEGQYRLCDRSGENEDDQLQFVTNTEQQRLERSQQEKTTGHLGQRSGERSDEAQNITILTGGFPCQEFSHAGKRKGTAGSRYKWPEMLSLIHKIKPDIVVAENVRGLVSWEQGLALETVCTNLEECGYSVQPLVIPACAVGAPHRRDRVWIVAYNKSTGTRQDISGLRGLSERCDERKQRLGHKEWNQDWREVALATCHDGVDDGLPRKLDGATYRRKTTDCISAAQHRKERLKACGNAIVPQVAMEIFKAIKQT